MSHFYHYSNTPLSRALVPTPRSSLSASIKPVGLWLTVQGEGGWAEWCDANDYPCGDCLSEVTLKAEANILHIQDEEEMKSFHQRYRSEDDHIDWRRVAEDYQGIHIPLLNGDLGTAWKWYTFWDVTSACVWDTSAIDDVVS